MTKFYKKLSPETKVVLPNNKFIKFDTLDGLVGFYATEHQYVQECFQTFMQQNRYAISEISEQEFMEQYVQKKRSSSELKPSWREEVGRGHQQGAPLIVQLGASAVADAVAVDQGKTDARLGRKIESPTPVPVSVAPASEAPKEAKPAVPAEYVPPTGKRKQARGKQT